MATLNIRQEIALVESGADVIITGGRATQIAVTITNGQIFRAENKVIADAFGNDILWQTGNGGMDTFELGLIIPTADVFIEFRTDNASPEFNLHKVIGKVWTFFGPLAGGDVTESIDGAVLVDGTDYDDIDSIRVHNDAAAAAGDVTVDFYLFN